MSAVNVQFSDSTEATVIAFFGAPQDAASYKNLGEIDSGDARWATFYAAVGALAQLQLPAPTT